MFANAHFRGKDDPAWEPADFLGTGNRQQRKQDKIGQLARRIKQARTRAEIEAFELENIPSWARMTDEEKGRLPQ